MRISHLHLTDFRNYKKKSVEFFPDTTLLIGPNGIGKSNVLEAVFLLSKGQSFKAQESSEMIHFGMDVAHIIGHVEYGKEESVGLHVVLTTGLVQGRRTATMSYKVDEVGRRRIDFVGKLKVVLFEPESLDIVIGDPQKRRDYLDEVLGQTSKEYAHSHAVYAKSLRVRNRLLDAIRDGKSSLGSLEYWERAMVKHGTLIQEERLRFLEWMNSQTADILAEYDASPIDEDRLSKYRDREIALGFTLIGPQRDDMKLQVTSHKSQVRELSTFGSRGEPSKDLASFGSRGEQRMAVLRLKLLEAAWIEQESNEVPVMLLDDIFSELDEEQERMVGGLVRGRQTIMTATEIHKGHYPQAKVIELG